MADNRAFAEKFSFPFLLLCDTTHELAVAYGAADGHEAPYPMRISYLIDPQGIVVRAYDQVNPQRHPGQILVDLASLSG